MNVVESVSLTSRLYLCLTSKLVHCRTNLATAEIAPTGVPFLKFSCGKPLTTGFVEIENEKATAFFKCLVCFKVSPKTALSSTTCVAEPRPEPLINPQEESNASGIEHRDSIAGSEA